MIDYQDFFEVGALVIRGTYFRIIKVQFIEY